MTWLQRWTDVLFLHFAVVQEELEPHLPPQLEIDTFEGQAWISFVFFHLQLRPAGLPFVPGFSSLVEMNVRTYVKHREQRGIYFLRMYADNRFAIQAARMLTPLCYEHAAMIDRRLPDGQRRIECWPSRNPHRGLSIDFTVPGVAGGARRATPADCGSRCDPQPPTPTEPDPNSHDCWLVERYRLFVAGSDGPILAGDVEHAPWEISPIELSVLQNNIGDAIGLRISNAPAAASFSTGVVARFNSFRRVATDLAGWDQRAQLAPAHQFLSRQ